MLVGSDADDGVATLWAAGAIALLLGLMVLGINLGAAMSGRHRAEAAADLAALAAAAHVVDGPEVACAHGVRVIDAMDARLVSCRVAGWEVFVEAEVAGPVPMIPSGDARGRARAGPAKG